MKKFPKDFYWGASTSAYQCEGGWNEGGKTPGINDIAHLTPENSEITDFRMASDHFHKWKEDVKLMAEMGMTMYRFSIEWSRVIPEPGKVNEEGINFYSDLIDELLKNNIEPLVTIFHFNTPVWLEKIGGWVNRDAIEYYYQYSKVLFERLGSKVKYWQTINEQNMYVLVRGVLTTEFGPADPIGAQISNHNMMVAQAKVMKLCHEITKGKIGPAPNIAVSYPETSKPEDFIAAQNFDAFRNWLYLDILCKGYYNSLAVKILKDKKIMFDILPEDYEVLADPKGRPDFLAINYYGTATIKMPEVITSSSEASASQQKLVSMPGYFEQVDNKNLERTKFGWEIDPVGFRATLRQVHDRYNLPIVITENGIGAPDELTEDFKIHDDYRIDFYKQHLKEISKCIHEGIDVFGYNPWSAFDLVSTHEGFKKRYGFIYIDRDEFNFKEMKRYKKDSFYWYKEVISENGENL